jgi:hypothetical protein
MYLKIMDVDLDVVGSLISIGSVDDGCVSGWL